MVNPEDYAIVVGIDGYSMLRPLHAARKDAEDFKEWLISPDGGGIPHDPNHIRIILSPDTLPGDNFDARPIKRDIDKALRDFGIKSDERIGRRLYFYFAGHGFGADFDDVGMLMADAAMDSLTNVGLRPYRKLFFDRGPFDEVVFILDCCRDNNKKRKTGEPEFDLDPKNPLPKVTDFVVLAAAYGERAFERDGNGNNNGEPRGVFTKALLEALRGKYPEVIDNQNRITTSTLRQFVAARMKDLTNDEKLRQDPEFLSAPNPEIVLCTIDPALIPTRTMRIVAPNGLQGDLILQDGNGNELRRNPANKSTNDEPWGFPLPLRNSNYVIIHSESDAELLLNPTRGKKDPYVLRFPRPE